jgi:hypothetical protein
MRVVDQKTTVPIFRFVNLGANLLFINHSDLSAGGSWIFRTFRRHGIIYFRAFGSYLGCRNTSWSRMHGPLMGLYGQAGELTLTEDTVPGAGTLFRRIIIIFSLV